MVDAAAIGAGVGARLVDIEAAIARHESFVFVDDDRPASDTEGGGDGEGDAVNAQDLVLRALRVAADPLNHGLLVRLGEGDSSLATLGRVLELPRVAAWERVNDLIQSGLVGRSLEHDSIGLTPAGQEFVELVSIATDAAAEHAVGARR